MTLLCNRFLFLQPTTVWCRQHGRPCSRGSPRWLHTPGQTLARCRLGIACICSSDATKCGSRGVFGSTATGGLCQCIGHEAVTGQLLFCYPHDPDQNCSHCRLPSTAAVNLKLVIIVSTCIEARWVDVCHSTCKAFAATIVAYAGPSSQ